MAVADFAALPEQGVRLIEETAEVLFCLTDVLADYGGQIDAIQVHAHFMSNHFRGHGLTRAALPGEQSADAQAAAHFLAEAPLLVHGRAMCYLLSDLVQQRRLR